VLNCKSQRDYAKDSCPELQFSCRQLTGTFWSLIRICFVKVDTDAVKEEKDKRQRDANAGKEEGIIPVSTLYISLFVQ
jgi:hypothetical protein